MKESTADIGARAAAARLPRKPRFAKAYSFTLVTLLLFLFSWAGQFVFQYIEFSDQQEQHGQAASLADYFPQFFASTLENWQSEFLQLVWQVVGLALFFHWGSSQSKESDERIEAKLDMLLAERGLPTGRDS